MRTLASEFVLMRSNIYERWFLSAKNRKRKLMNWLRSARALIGWKASSPQPLRRRLARACLRLGSNSAQWAESLALWIDPTIETEAEAKSAAKETGQ